MSPPTEPHRASRRLGRAIGRLVDQGTAPLTDPETWPAEVRALRHLPEQQRVLGALARTVAKSAGRTVSERTRLGAPPPAVALPGREVIQQVPSPTPELVADYLRWCGVDPARYGGLLPPHLFPQWAVPALSRAVSVAPYPLVRILNAGCRLEALAPVPAGVPLEVVARLESIDDDGRRAILRQRVVTRAGGREVLAAEFTGFVPLQRGGSAEEQKARPRVPEAVQPVSELDLGPRAGLAYAALTGDVNPIHWLPPWARLAGFPRPILHGFASFALTWERLVDRLGGETAALGVLDARFTRPLVLPRRIGVYVEDDQVTVGDAPGERAYLAGRFEVRH